MNKKTIAITAEQYKTIIATMKQGFSGCRPNERIATALILEANLGLRISDIVKLRLADIVHDGDRYRLSIRPLFSSATISSFKCSSVNGVLICSLFSVRHSR